MFEHCNICHMSYVSPDEDKIHEQRHKAWLEDASLTKEEYRKLIAADDKDFQGVRVKGYYYGDSGLYRKIVENIVYDYEDSVFRRGDMLSHLQLEYLHQETISLPLKQKKRIRDMLACDLLQKITADDELWQHIKDHFGMSNLLSDRED
ncbi:hypothetical protein [Ktedonobacter racemifer]|uniref:Uncharacterized protein n=1 Tax=Ktedonobacter racemifer DSM 44963 TaxID=485913 RepID=D6U8Y5_KTERA|nr:hypothetical protein [Ktedonobacter racemifer]EFH79540.1 hypothetical protein Krac_0050 [Ktedonobacter racemifer DSM 44963]